MKLYEIIIKPQSAFGTPLKGDTVFGQFCWQYIYDTGENDSEFKAFIETYLQRPMIVFSSAVPLLRKSEKTYVFKKPDLPTGMIVQQNDLSREDYIREKKQLRSKKWMLVGEDLTLDFSKSDLYVNDSELMERMGRERDSEELIRTFSKSHNTINRITGTTGNNMFAPYQEDAFCYLPDTELAILALVDDERLPMDRVKRYMEYMGSYGFGKDASTGNGRFTVVSVDKLTGISHESAEAVYSLAPSVTDDESFKHKYFKLFVRFGKHGGTLATSGNPFKKPIMMEDEGAVYVFNETAEIKQTPYIGQAVSHVSKSQVKTVVQGYSPYLPVKNLVIT